VLPSQREAKLAYLFGTACPRVADRGSAQERRGSEYPGQSFAQEGTRTGQERELSRRSLCRWGESLFSATRASQRFELDVGRDFRNRFHHPNAVLRMAHF